MKTAFLLAALILTTSACMETVEGPPAVGGGGGSTATDGGSGGGGGSMQPDAGPHLIRALFDGAHSNSVGNANWVVDAHAPDPEPAAPTSETAWSGGVSSWAYELFRSGRYQIKQLPQGQYLNYGKGGAGDLSKVEVFISDEPETNFTSVEQAALVEFAHHGGGLVMVADHLGAKRCTYCTESWQVINSFLQLGASNEFGVSCDGNNIGDRTGWASSASLATRFTSGKFGTGSSLSFHDGTSVSLTNTNTAAQLIVTSASGAMVAAAPLPSGGRLVLIGDSSPTDDGTCANCGAALINGWKEADNNRLILNATAWAAHDE